MNHRIVPALSLLLAGAPLIVHAASGSSVMQGDLIEQGRGTPLVLVPAAGSPGAALDALAAALVEAQFRVLRPRGPASAPQLIESLKAAKPGPVVLIADGDAGAVARRVALDAPELVRGVVLAGEPAGDAGVARPTPAAPALYLTAAGNAAAAMLAQAQKDWGTRLTARELPGSAASLQSQPREAAPIIVAWLRGPALSATVAGQRIAAPEDESQMSAEQRSMNQGLRDSLNTTEGRRVGVVGPRAVLLHDTRLLKGYLGFGDVMATAPVPLRYKELAILVTARAFDSDYEWFAHEKPALNAGVPPEVVAAIKVGRTPQFTQAADRIVYDYADEIHRTHHVSDATYQKAWDLLGTSGLVNLTMVIGHYMNVATTLNVHRLPLPAGAAGLPPREAR